MYRDKYIISIEALRKVYDRHRVSVEALKGINLQVKEGAFLAVVGPSGSGKTTLLNLIGGLDKATSGKVIINGEEITRLSQRKLAQLRLKDIGFVFQAYNLIPVLTALENVEFVMLLQGVGAEERKQRSYEILKEVGLKDCINCRPDEMSGGQQQRVAVARAIVSEPKIILADEPTASLDSKTTEGLVDLMRELNCKKRITFIFSTHDEVVIKRTEERVYLRDGQTVCQNI